jgi:hypothetical protein
MVEWKKDQNICNIIQQLQEELCALDKFVWKNYLMWYQDCLYLCKNYQLKYKVLLELHTSPIGGHLGFLKNYRMIKNIFSRKVLKLIFKSLWLNGWFVNKIRER